MKPHFLFLALFLTVAPLQAGARKSASSMWKPAEGWKMEMEQFSRTDPSELGPARYVLRALVTGKSTNNNVECWNVGFIPGEQMPRHLDNHYSISVGKDSGSTLKILYVRSLKRVPESVLMAGAIGLGHPQNRLGLIGATPPLASGLIRAVEQTDWLERFGNTSFITAAPEGFPIEIFPLYEPGQFLSAKSGAMLTLRRQKEGEYLVLEAALKVGDKDTLLIRQKWIEGEQWWREYERYVDGRKDLQARQVMPPPVKAEPAIDPTKPDPLHLHRDPKLQVVIEVEERGAKLPVLIERINKATGLLLTVDPSLVNHQPDLGVIQPSKGGWRAGQVMSIIEGSQLEDGRWLKTANGYKLTGISKARTPVVLAEDGVAPGTPVVASGGAKRWLIGGSVVLGIVLIAIGLAFVLRRSARTVGNDSKTALTSKKPSAE